ARRRAAEQWLQRGRNLPGQSAAALRLRAHRQRLEMRAARAAFGPAQVSSSSGGWIPIGPAPLASDASGFGQQGYNWVWGRATAVAVDPADTDGNTVFVGGAYGGLWRSENAGAASASPADVVWTPLLDDQATLAIGAVAIQPGNNNPQKTLVLVGTGETNSSGDSYYGLGILRSTDAGSSWQLIAQSSDTPARTFAGLGFSRIAFSQLNPSVIVASTAGATEGYLEGLEDPINTNRGLYFSLDA